MNDIKVSVICLAYNHEKYIRKTLEGFVSQKTDFKFEVIVHDDASTDDTRQIIEEYANKYPDIFVPVYQNENQYSKKLPGGGIIGNFICPLIKGKYVAFCEGDDYWCSENKLQMQYEIMENDSSLSLCVHKVQCVNEDGSNHNDIIPYEYYHINQGLLDEKKITQALFIDGGCPFHTGSFFIKKEVIDKVYNCEIDFAMKVNGDVLCQQFALLYGNYFYIDEIMSCYRLFSSGSWTSKRSEQSVQSKINFRMGIINGKKLFDEYTNYKYHELIGISIFKSILPLCELDLNKAREVYKEFDFDKSVVKKALNNIALFNRVKYFLCMHCPFVLKMWYKIKG